MQIFLWFRQKLACLKFFRRTQKMPGFLMQYGRLPWTLPKTCKTEQLNCVTLLSKLTFSFSHFLKVSHDLKQDMWVILEVIKNGQSSQARIFLKAMCILLQLIQIHSAFLQLPIGSSHFAGMVIGSFPTALDLVFPIEYLWIEWYFRLSFSLKPFQNCHKKHYPNRLSHFSTRGCKIFWL